MMPEIKSYFIVLSFICLVSGCNNLKFNDSSTGTPAETPLSCDVAASPFGGGSGTMEDPYMICSVAHFDGLRTHITEGDHGLDKYYKLGADIDLAGQSFAPLGDDSAGSFAGTFDGDNKKVSNWSYTVTDGTVYYVGFFTQVAGSATIKNFILENINLLLDYTFDPDTTWPIVGGLVGSAYGSDTRASLISNCGVSGVIDGMAEQMGGLVGYSNSGDIWDSYANITITNIGPNATYTGGLIGSISSWSYGHTGSIERSYATGSVTAYNTDPESGGDIVGGLVGYFGPGHAMLLSYATTTVNGDSGFTGGLAGHARRWSHIYRSYATGSVTNLNTFNNSSSSTGGLVGYNGANLENTYATGSVTGTSNVGGLIGKLYDDGSSNSYSVGTVSGTSNVGGLIGNKTGGNISSSFWDTQTSGQASSAGGAGVLGKTTVEMETHATFANWNFNDYWQISEGTAYPTLK